MPPKLARASLGMLLLAATMAPAAAAGPKGEDDAYTISLHGRYVSTNVSLEAIRSVQKTFSGDFLWARRAGKEYLIRDRGILGEAHALFAPLRALEPEEAELERRQSRLEIQQETLNREQEELERELDRLTDDSESQPREAHRRRLERRQRELESRGRDLEDRESELEVVQRSLDRREDELEEKAERELWRLLDGALARGLAKRIESR